MRAGFARKLEEEGLSYLNSLLRHAAMDDARSVVVRKAGVGDHTAERFADHELNANHGLAFGQATMDWKTVKRISPK